MDAAIILISQEMSSCQLLLYVWISILFPNNRLLWHSIAFRSHQYDPDDTNAQGKNSYTVDTGVLTLLLQLVGLAFEVNTAHTNTETNSADDPAQKHELETFGQLNFVDIMHYGFNYIGVLTGKIYAKHILLIKSDQQR